MHLHHLLRLNHPRKERKRRRKGKRRRRRKGKGEKEKEEKEKENLRFPEEIKISRKFSSSFASSSLVETESSSGIVSISLIRDFSL